MGAKRPQTVLREEVQMPRHIQPVPARPPGLAPEGGAIRRLHHQDAAIRQQGSGIRERRDRVTAMLQDMRDDHQVEAARTSSPGRDSATPSITRMPRADAASRALGSGSTPTSTSRYGASIARLDAVAASDVDAGPCALWRQAFHHALVGATPRSSRHATLISARCSTPRCSAASAAPASGSVGIIVVDLIVFSDRGSRRPGQDLAELRHVAPIQRVRFGQRPTAASRSPRPATDETNPRKSARSSFSSSRLQDCHRAAAAPPWGLPASAGADRARSPPRMIAATQLRADGVGHPERVGGDGEARVYTGGRRHERGVCDV